MCVRARCLTPFRFRPLPVSLAASVVTLKRRRRLSALGTRASFTPDRSIDRFNDAAHWREALTTPFVTRKVLSSPPSLFTSVLPGGREKRGKPSERRTDGRGDGSNRERE